MIIRELDKDTVKQVYNTQMKTDFPPAELKPLSSIERMSEEERYLCTGLFDEDGEMFAYGFFVVSKDTNSLLLDYLAVCDGGRGMGYGGIYMEEMKQYFSHKDGIFIECESVSSAVAEEERDIRSRRIHFYESHGAKVTESMSHLFDVEYSILYLPVGAEFSQEESHGTVESIYGEMFPMKYRDKIRLWEEKNR